MFIGFFTRSDVSRGQILRGVKMVLAALLVAWAATFVTATTADARLGGGASFGSRGSRTFSMPSATPTAPRVSPFQRSATPNPGWGNSGLAPAGSGFLGGGFGRGLIGGFLGAGLFGMLFGGGLTGGLGGGMSLIGLIMQIGLLYLGFRFVSGFFAARRMANGGGPAPFGGLHTGGLQGGAVGGIAPAVPINIGPEDYQAFEHRLAESQAAYSDRNISALHRIATPEMSGSFEQEIAENDRHGVVNKISDVRLLQGDLAEAWREQGSDYATVAMRFSLVDATVEKASGRLVAGDATRPQEVTEVWTFRRPAGGGAQAWTLSAIQQA
jgi:hypothetical protein